MKGSTLGLVVAVAVCATSTFYFWHELGEANARADEVTAASQKLKDRIAELERARVHLADRRFPGGGMFGGGSLAQGGPGPASAAPPDGESAAKEDETRVAAFRPDRSPAMQKMMRTQMRANFKRMYADLASQLGLSKDDANKLYDMLADQQIGAMERFRDSEESGDPRKRWEDVQRDQQAELANFLGADKAEALQKYQESMPARGEVEMIARQLEGSDAGLSDDQRKHLVAALTEERERVPPPEYVEGADSEQYQKSMAEWQDAYNERAAARAKSILNSEQQTAYTEYQQLQKEMREQFATLGPPGPGGRRLRVNGGVAMPAGGAVFMNTVTVAGPPPPEDGAKKK
jgi:hypothetical protein